jgi:hypothetical protein
MLVFFFSAKIIDGAFFTAGYYRLPTRDNMLLALVAGLFPVSETGGLKFCTSSDVLKSAPTFFLSSIEL